MMKKAGGSNHLVGSCDFLTHLLYLDQAPEHEYMLRHTYGTDGAQAKIDSCFLCLKFSKWAQTTRVLSSEI